MHLQHDNMSFFPLALRFITCFLGHVQKSKFRDFWTGKLGISVLLIFFRVPFLSFSNLCAAVIRLLLNLRAVQMVMVSW